MEVEKMHVVVLKMGVTKVHKVVAMAKAQNEVIVKEK